MLKVLEEFSEYISGDIGLEKEYVYLTILTIFAILFFDIAKFVIRKIYSALQLSDKKKYYRNR